MADGAPPPAADEEPAERPQPAITGMKPTGGEKLAPDVEKRLRWGEPSAGLRAAILIRPAPAKPKWSEFSNELYLAVQNVSDSPIRLNDTTAASKLREVYIKRDGRILTGVVAKDPTGTDVTLKPREVVFLLMFPRDDKGADKPTAGSVEAKDLLDDSHMTMVGELQIEHAPAGAWTGKLRTGDTNGEAAAGKLPTGETKFRVTAADPDAAKKPRAANRPGRYVLGDNARLLVSQTTTVAQCTNKAVIVLLSPDPKVAAPHKPYEIALPDGIRAYGIAWERGAGALWVMQEGLVRNYDFSNPAEVKETRFEPGRLVDVPVQLRDALRKVFDPEARALIKLWQENNARRNGDIPGGLVGRLAEKMKQFSELNSGDRAGVESNRLAKEMERLVPRCDAARDWTPAEVVALLDDIAAICTVPLYVTLEETAERTLKTGAPLPPDLANAPWGKTQPEGLRMAWLLEPRAAEYRLGTPLRSRILLHNAGKNPVVFRTHTWHQVGYTARDSKGAEIKVHSVYFTTLPPFAAFRLAPGEFVELIGTGIGVGVNKNDEDWQNTGVVQSVEAKTGDDVTLTTGPILVSNTLWSGPVPSTYWNKRRPDQEDEPDWWLGFINARLSRELPLPAAPAERTRLLDRVVRDLFGAAPTAEETAAFLADASPAALDSLAKRLEHRPGLTTFSGKMTSGPTKFHVFPALPADPDAAKKPRTANNPGHYPLREGVVLAVSRGGHDYRIMNYATIAFSSSDKIKPAPGKPYELKLPDDYDTWAAAWVRGGTVLWLQDKSGVRSCDFSNPAKVKEEAVQPDKVPVEIGKALRGVLPAPAPPASVRP